MRTSGARHIVARSIARLCFALLFGLAVSPAHAQDQHPVDSIRSDRFAAEREKKAIETSSPEQTAGLPPARNFVGALASASRLTGNAVAEFVAQSRSLREKTMFKGFRLSSCQPVTYAAPTIGTPGRTEPAVSLCQP